MHSRAWKGQVPYLAQHYRVVTIDPPGNGRSGPLADPAAYDDLASSPTRSRSSTTSASSSAVLVGICVSAWQALLTASLHPDRVQGVVAVAPWVRDFTPPIADPAGGRAALRRGARRLRGLVRLQPPLLPDHWPEYAAFFFDQMLPEPHSTKQLEDIVGSPAPPAGT